MIRTACTALAGLSWLLLIAWFFIEAGEPDYMTACGYATTSLGVQCDGR